ncbi:MAG: hypothetical protein K2X69_08470 [Silvanigrellaceae bacterium]|nr:hypothetical protein [Silvanigrellaceae bacterium]
MSFNKKYKYNLNIEDIIKNSFTFTNFDILSIIELNNIYSKNYYSLGFNIDFEKLTKTTNQFNSFRIEFEFYKNQKNENETIINIMFKTSLYFKDNPIYKLINEIKRKIEKNLIDEISNTDILITLNDKNKEIISEIIGNLILFTKSPEYFINNDISIIENSKENYNIIKLISY